MIPLSMKQKTVTFTDGDGVTWTFAVKSGANEMRLIQLYEEAKTDSTGAWMQKQMVFFNEIVQGWSGSGMAAFPPDGNPAVLFTSSERAEVFGCWHEANSLGPEQKKS